MNLYELETSLFNGKYLNSKEYLENIFHDEFMEYGKSGLIYRKEDTIESLFGIGDRNIKVIDFTSEKIDENTYIVHYVSIHNENVKVLRTSIWKDNGERLQLFFHQGTLMHK